MNHNRLDFEGEEGDDSEMLSQDVQIYFLFIIIFLMMHLDN